MPYVQTPSAGVRYALVAFDADGNERLDDPDGSMSERVLQDAASGSYSDLFVMSHGWLGDIPSARKQYDAWVDAMAAYQASVPPTSGVSHIRPLIVGLHWPSLPWGDEELGDPGVSFVVGSPTPVERQVEAFAQRIADSAEARDALQTIFAAAAQNPIPDRLPDDVDRAYRSLIRESGMQGKGEGAPPGSDGAPFDAEDRYQAAREQIPISFGGSSVFGDLLAPLRMLSFWKMKERGRRVGESGGHRLLNAIQHARSDLRIHLMGHSFGSIVVSASIAGEQGGARLSRPVQSLVLVQGALSLWSYCSDIPSRPGQPGYFCPIVNGGGVAGPTLTTRSRFDLAVGRWYPLGAGVARQVDFAAEEFPRYGGVGAFGLQGPGVSVVDLPLKSVGEPYEFSAGHVFNLECSAIIRNGGGSSGAHSDIVHPELAHAVWSAAQP